MQLIIERGLPDCLQAALTEFDATSNLQAVLDINIIVKQLKNYEQYSLGRRTSGALTQAAYNAMKKVAHFAAPLGSKVAEINNKCGHSYVIADSCSGRKFHISKSSGKHLNAVVSFLEWVNENADRVLNKRDVNLNESEKLQFFNTLEALAKNDAARLEMLELSSVAIAKLKSNAFQQNDTRKRLADLIWIAMDRNQHHIKAIAANFRSNAPNLMK